MKKFAIAALSLAAAGAVSAGTIQLKPVYLGSTTASLAAPSGSQLVPAGSLSLLDFSQAANRDGTWKHWFRVDMAFTPANAGEDFRFINWDVVNPEGGLTKINRLGSTSSTLKYMAYNPSSSQTGAGVYNLNSDGGTAGDLLALATQQTGAEAAMLVQNGEAGSEFKAPDGSTPLGFFCMTGGAGFSATQSIVIQPAAGASLSFYTGNANGDSTTVQTVGSGISSGQVQLVVGDIPEPATLSLAALGGLAVIRRRRA